MAKEEDWRIRLTTRLRELAERAEPPGGGAGDGAARATLAQLRRAAGKPFDAAAFGWVVAAGVPQSLQDENDALLVASLFALTPVRGGPELPVGAAFRRLRAETNSDSIEKRFGALLESSREDLDEKLRHAVKLLKSKDIHLDWKQLLDDLRRWNRLKKSVQRQWSRDYWKQAPNEKPETPNPTKEN